MTCAALLIVNSVSCLKRIAHESHFSWQARHLGTLEDDLRCFVHCKSRFPDLPMDPCFIRPLFDKGLFLEKIRGLFL